LHYPEYDPACHELSAADYARVRAVAADVVTLYGGGGPPFPITELFRLLEPATEIVGPSGDPREAGVYGYTAPIDFAIHRKHARLFLDTSAPPEQVFVTAFHEGGHVLLHIMRDRALGALPLRRAAARRPDLQQAEVEADLFARLTMMPAPWVRARWPAACRGAGGRRPAVAEMAALFGVPEEWMADRLQALGLLARRAP
jgi:hypothetical protein